MESFSFLALILAVSVVLFYVFEPFLKTLMLAVVLAILFSYPYEKLVRIFFGKRGAAASMLVFVVLIFCIAPLFYLGSQLLQESQILYGHIIGNEAHYVHTIQTIVETPVRHFFPTFVFNVNNYIANILSFISNNLAGLISQTLVVFFDVFLTLLAFFFFLQDGKRMISEIISVSPFKREYTEEIIKTMYVTINSVIRGTIFVALVRWVVIAISFYMFGISNAILWGSVGGFIGAVPGLGTPFVFIPAVVYLYLQGNITGAIGMAIFGILTVVLVDNILTSFYFHKGLKTSPVFILFSIFGGIIFFGPMGFIFGPLILSVFISLMNIHSTFLYEKNKPEALTIN
jgi:predicted PurR-regulated permease PerM